MPKIEERETYTGYTHGDKNCYLYSEEKSWIRIMKNLIEKYPEDVRLMIDNGVGMEIEYPVEWLSIKPDHRPARKTSKHG